MIFLLQLCSTERFEIFYEMSWFAAEVGRKLMLNEEYDTKWMKRIRSVQADNSI